MAIAITLIVLAVVFMLFVSVSTLGLWHWGSDPNILGGIIILWITLLVFVGVVFLTKLSP